MGPPETILGPLAGPCRPLGEVPAARLDTRAARAGPSRRPGAGGPADRRGVAAASDVEGQRRRRPARSAPAPCGRRRPSRAIGPRSRGGTAEPRSEAGTSHYLGSGARFRRGSLAAAPRGSASASRALGHPWTPRPRAARRPRVPTAPRGRTCARTTPPPSRVTAEVARLRSPLPADWLTPWARARQCTPDPGGSQVPWKTEFGLRTRGAPL